jgi:hypothetical protein
MQILLQTRGFWMDLGYQSYRCYWSYPNMPLPSVLIHGARQCKAITKRSKKRCLNPAAYGCSTCRYHGATPVHTRKTVAGENHPQFKHGRNTKQAKERNQRTTAQLHFLEDLGHHIKMFQKDATRTRGRKPNGYLKLNLSDSKQLLSALIKSIEGEDK